MKRQTPTQRLASLVLGRDLGEYVRGHRDNGLSWEAIADELQRDTSGELDLASETLRAWYRKEERRAG